MVPPLGSTQHSGEDGALVIFLLLLKSHDQKQVKNEFLWAYCFRGRVHNATGCGGEAGIAAGYQIESREVTSSTTHTGNRARTRNGAKL